MDSKSDQICIREDPTAQKYFNPLAGGITKNFIDNFLVDIKNLKMDSLLDIGCGTGYITKSWKFTFPHVLGVTLRCLALNLRENISVLMYL